MFWNRGFVRGGAPGVAFPGMGNLAAALAPPSRTGSAQEPLPVFSEAFEQARRGEEVFWNRGFVRGGAPGVAFPGMGNLAAALAPPSRTGSAQEPLPVFSEAFEQARRGEEGGGVLEMGFCEVGVL